MSAALLTQEPWLRVADNGLLVAQARRRLRRKEAVPGFIMTGVMCLFGTLVCLLNEAAAWDGFRGFLLFVMGVMLYLRATSILVLAVARERESGLLDFHRATPVTPQTQALGYVLGCSAREWVTCAVILPFFLFASAFSGKLIQDVMCLAVMCLGAVLYQTFAVWLGLVGGGSTKQNTGMLMLAVMGTLLAGSAAHAAGLITLGHLTPFPAMLSLYRGHGTNVDFFGLEVPPVIFTVLVQGHALTFIGWAVTRKLRRDGASSFSRPGALLFLATVVVLILGGTWDMLTGPSAKPGNESGTVGMLASFYLVGTTVLCMGLLWIVTPEYLDFIRALRRARSLGFKAPSMLEDGGSTLPLVAVMGALLLAGLGTLMAGQTAVPLDVMLSQSTLLGVASGLAMMGFAAGVGEYTRLSLRGAYRSGASLILFVVVVVPWLAAGLAYMASEQSALALYIASLSPVGVVVSMVDLTQHWSHVADETLLWPTVISLTSCLGVSAFLHVRVATIRAEAAEGIPLERPN